MARRLHARVDRRDLCLVLWTGWRCDWAFGDDSAKSQARFPAAAGAAASLRTDMERRCRERRWQYGNVNDAVDRLSQSARIERSVLAVPVGRRILDGSKTCIS